MSRTADRPLPIPLLTALLCALALLGSPASAATGSRGPANPAAAQAGAEAGAAAAFIVQRTPGTGPAAERAVESLGGVVGAPLAVIDGFLATLPPAALPALAAAPGVAAVTPDRRIAIQSATWDAAEDTGSLLSTAEIVQAGYAWSRGYTGAGVGVALIDTGVVPVEGLDSGVVHGPDLSFEGANPGLRYLDTNGHGTHMAGIIAGRDADWEPGTGTGFGGIAPDATLISVKVAVANGATDVSQVIAAIDWVVQHRAEHGIRVLNLSFGTDGVQDYRIDPLAFAVENAWHKGIVVVASAGNSGFTGGRLKNPAYDPYVIAVGAGDARGTKPTHDDVVPAWSNRGDGQRNPDVVAPGQSIVSLRNPGSYSDRLHQPVVLGDRFVRGSGTSQAAAVVSGAAALLLQQRPELTPDEVKSLLTSSAVPLPEAEAQAQGHGLIDIREALRAPTPSVRQEHRRAGGMGLLQPARGSLRVPMAAGSLLLGELDAALNLWTPLLWTYRTVTDGAWRGGGQVVWDAAHWSGVVWAGGTWLGNGWGGNGWGGNGWGGGTWESTWLGNGWGGNGWGGNGWGGQAWDTFGWAGGWR